MRCSRCHHDNSKESFFCAECGYSLAVSCPSCAYRNKPAEKFCSGCGAAILPSPHAYTPPYLAQKILTSKSSLEGERKQITVLFCDIANSTRLAERLGPEKMHTLLNEFFDRAAGVVHQYEGTINQYLGDGFMALFGAPLAFEDHARRAVLTALKLQENIRGERIGHGSLCEELPIRVGLNTGVVVVGKIGDNLRMDYTAVGDTTNLAARLQELAEPGSVYISETTHRAVKSHFDCQPLGSRKVKGKSEEVVVYRVRAICERGFHDQSGLTLSSPLIGRESEITTLRQAVERLLERRGSVIAVLGEAGIGKSRLVAEVRELCQGKDLLWLEGRALSFSQGISYWPFMEILKRYAGIKEEDAETQRWANLQRKLRSLFPEDLEEILPYLASLLTLEVKGEFTERVKYLDGEGMKRQVFRASRLFFERLASQNPLVLVFEDWHWADQSSAGLLEHLLPLVAKAPLLICCVARPDENSKMTRIHDIAVRDHICDYIEIVLRPLSDAQSKELLSHLLDVKIFPGALRDVILSKTEGNPFFVEEVVRTLIQTKAVVRNTARSPWQGTSQLEEFNIPDTVQAVIIARVDRLDEEVKEVLRLAAVIGRSFFYRILRSIMEAGSELDQQLNELQRLELIREKRNIPELEYMFKHALAQEAVYESILSNRRQELHKQVGHCIETVFSNRLEEFYGLLAYHYARAEEWEKAQEYLFKAGDQASSIAADAEALNHYQEALRAYARVFGDRWEPLQRARLDRKIGEALYRRGEHQQAIQYLERALRHLGRPLPSSQWGMRFCLFGQLLRQVWHVMFSRGSSVSLPKGPDAVAIEISRIYDVLEWIFHFMESERFLTLSLIQLNFCQKHQLASGIVQGLSFGIICDILGLSALAQHYHREAVSIAERNQNPLAKGNAFLGLGMHERYRGESDAALMHLERAVNAYQEVGDLRGTAAATVMLAIVGGLRGKFTYALELSEKVIQIGQDGADHQALRWGLGIKGIILGMTGDLGTAVSCLKQSIELSRAIPDYYSWAVASANLGKCYLRQGRVSEAIDELERTNSILLGQRIKGIPRTYSRLYLAEAYLLQAEEAPKPERAHALNKAWRACRNALKQCKIDCEAMMGAYRARGTFEWLNGNRARAERWWQRSLEAAQKLNAPQELGLTYVEIGLHLKENRYLGEAQRVFAEIGAASDLHRVQQLLNRINQVRSNPIDA